MKLPEPINIFTHFALGVWVGLTLNNPTYRTSALALFIAFEVYQIQESLRKGDGGWIEMKQFMIGMAVALAYKRAEKWIKTTLFQK